MQKINSVQSNLTVLNRENIDTDQIIPAAFLKVTKKDGFGQHAFAAWRFDSDGKPKADFVLNDKRALNSEVLLAGENFGCGSSREHAPWALLDFGFRVIISTRFADIFKNNALKNGLLVIEIDSKAHAVLCKETFSPIEISLSAQRISCAAQNFQFEIDPFRKNCLLNGLSDLDVLLKYSTEISIFEEAKQ